MDICKNYVLIEVVFKYFSRYETNITAIAF